MNYRREGEPPKRRMRYRGHYVRRRAHTDGRGGSGSQLSANYSEERQGDQEQSQPNWFHRDTRNFRDLPGGDPDQDNDGGNGGNPDQGGDSGNHRRAYRSPDVEERDSSPRTNRGGGRNHQNINITTHQPLSSRVEDLTKAVRDLKLTLDDRRNEIEQLKLRIIELESNATKRGATIDAAEERERRRKLKLAKVRERKLAKNAERRAIGSGDAPGTSGASRADIEGVEDDGILNSNNNNQGADTGSSEKQANDNGDGGKGRQKHYRRKKPYNLRNRKGYRRESSNNTSPENDDDQPQPGSSKDGNSTTNQNTSNNHPNQSSNSRQRNSERTYPSLSDGEMRETVQALNRDFLADKPVRKTIQGKGPKVASEFVISILDHAICDVTSPAKISDIANNMHQLLVGERDDMILSSFYDALSNIASRENDIAIDAPRYMDTLGQILAECVIPMHTRSKFLARKFVNRCLEAYTPAKSKSLLLASMLRNIASSKSERCAKDIFDASLLSWDSLTEADQLESFLEENGVKFTTMELPPEPKKPKKSPEELEKFADDITAKVEAGATPQALTEYVKTQEFSPEDLVDYRGTLVYAIVRGCVSSETGDYKLDTEALSKYSPIFISRHKDRDAAALKALTALTKLWHQYNCPQDLMRTILLALHSQGAASYEALKIWLNSESLNNIPGIGAARLNSKRCIEDLGASLGKQ